MYEFVDELVKSLFISCLIDYQDETKSIRLEQFIKTYNPKLGFGKTLPNALLPRRSYTSTTECQHYISCLHRRYLLLFT